MPRRDWASIDRAECGERTVGLEIWGRYLACASWQWKESAAVLGTSVRVKDGKRSRVAKRCCNIYWSLVMRPTIIN
jgi:hypothetical protein